MFFNSSVVGSETASLLGGPTLPTTTWQSTNAISVQVSVLPYWNQHEGSVLMEKGIRVVLVLRLRVKPFTPLVRIAITRTQRTGR
jgi:hypothetical protein